MTNLEAAKAAIGQNYPFDEDTFILGLTSAGLDPAAEQVPGKTFDLALAALILYLIAAAERISEGGYTVELNADALMELYRILRRRWDKPDLTGPILRDRTWMW
jgi:hypothetical protein